MYGSKTCQAALYYGVPRVKLTYGMSHDRPFRIEGSVSRHALVRLRSYSLFNSQRLACSENGIVVYYSNKRFLARREENSEVGGDFANWESEQLKNPR